MKAPPCRTITRKTATEIDQFGYPVDDGKDVPGWEYTELRTYGTTDVIRVPTRYIGNYYDNETSFDSFGWLPGDR
jgi:predicted FMN-binding regulatory protein PaiB